MCYTFGVSEIVRTNFEGIPTASCVCGEEWMKVPVIFDKDTYEIAMYGLVATCMSCGASLTAPTPLDLPEGGWLVDGNEGDE